MARHSPNLGLRQRPSEVKTLPYLPPRACYSQKSPMRLGILSDIHANYEALSAVVEAFKREDIDKY